MVARLRIVVVRSRAAWAGRSVIVGVETDEVDWVSAADGDPMDVGVGEGVALLEEAHDGVGGGLDAG